MQASVLDFRAADLESRVSQARLNGRFHESRQPPSVHRAPAVPGASGRRRMSKTSKHKNVEGF